MPNARCLQTVFIMIKYGLHSAHIGAFLFGLLLFFGILLLLDVYVSKGLRAAVSKFPARIKRGIIYIYWFVNICFFILTLYLIIGFAATSNASVTGFKIAITLFVTLYSSKIVYGLFLLAEDIYRSGRWGVLKFLKSVSISKHYETPYFPSRRRFISQAAALAAGIPFIGSIYGVIKGKYNFKVHKVELAFRSLPKAFDGFTITQVSDIHSGSFGDRNEVIKGINLVNEQKSDIIFFTGDLVNMRSSEMVPWMDVFNRLNAPMGVFSTLGNHDYGDYTEWPTPEAKQANFEEMCKIHSQLGYQLLRNNNCKIKKGDSYIDLLGVENWGRGGFSKYGDLDKAFDGTSSDSFKILLSHDPTHWEEKVMNDPRMIHLTLSGHTHGFQFGFELPGIRFSPAEFHYKRWAGLYIENNKYLYVNRGFGYLAYPGRVGIWPEITVITLKSA